MGPCISHLCCNTPKCVKMCSCCMGAHDRYSDDVRAEVGVPSEQLELLANCIEKYSEAAMDMATSTHALCNQLDNLAAYETSDARVMLVQWSDHLRVQEFGECDHKQSYTEAERTKYLDFCTTHNLDLTKGAPLPQLLLVLRQYQIKYKKEIEPELKIHDKLWTTHQNAMTDQHKATHNTQKPQLTSGAAAESAADGTPAEEFPVIAEPSQADQLAAVASERQVQYAGDAYTRSQMALRDRIAEHKVRRREDLRDLVSLLAGRELGLHSCSLERLTRVADHVGRVPSVSRTSIAGARPVSSVSEQRPIQAADVQVTRYVDGKLQPLEMTLNTGASRCTRSPLPPRVFHLLHSLETRFGPSMMLPHLDALLREMLFNAPSEENVSEVTHRFFTIFSPSTHAMANNTRHRAEKVGAMRTKDFTVGLATLITEGGLQVRIRNGWDIIDVTKQDHLPREAVVDFLSIVTKHVIDNAVLEQLTADMFAVMDFDQSGAIGFDEFWEFASLPDNVDLWNWMDLYAHHLGAMVGEGMLGFVYVQRIRAESSTASYRGQRRASNPNPLFGTAASPLGGTSVQLGNTWGGGATWGGNTR